MSRLKKWVSRLVGKSSPNEKSSKSETRGPEYWANIGNHKEYWDTRGQMLAEMLKPSDRSVFEFGAGRCAIREIIGKSKTYLHHDLVARHADTVVADLNARPLAKFPPTDVAIFSGVIEYIVDFEDFLAQISSRYRSIVCSYVVFELGGSMEKRQDHSWVNAYTADELVQVFTKAGYSKASEGKFRQDQLVFRFERKEA